MRGVPKLNELHAKHKDQGLVLIGVHSTNGGEKMEAFVKERGVNYPVAIDVDGATAAKYFVDGRPDYHIIDRSGNVRVADLANSEVPRVIEALLAEPALPAVPAALAKASERATKRHKRILGVFGAEADTKALARSFGRRGPYGAMVSNEFEVVAMDPAAEAELAAAAEATGEGVRLAVYDAGGKLLASAAAPADEAGTKRFLEAHRVPIQSAQALLDDALARATREKKRVLVHLGAPW